MKVGAATVKEVYFKGCPQPKVEWTFKGGKLPDPKRIKTETIVNMSTIKISKSQRSDAGKYNAALSNDHGSATYTLNVTVIGKQK